MAIIPFGSALWIRAFITWIRAATFCGASVTMPQTQTRSLATMCARFSRIGPGTCGLARRTDSDLLNRGTNTFSHYQHDKADRDSLTDSFVMSLYEDASGLVWIGTRAGGVSHWDPRSWELGSHRPPCLSDKLVTAFADAPDDKVWIASLGGGLMQFDVSTGEATDIDTITGRRGAVGDQRVMALHQDTRGALWIGTMTSGLSKLAPGGRVESIPVKAGDARSLSAAGLITIFEARSGQLWIGTHGGGANVLDPRTGLIRQLSYGTQAGAIAPNVNAISEDL